MSDPNASSAPVAGSWSSKDDEARIERYRAEARLARETVRGIDAGEWTYHEAHGSGPMQDVTQKRRADQIRVAEMMEHLAAAWARRA